MILTFIMLLLVIKIFVLSILEWPLKTGFTVYEFIVWLKSSETVNVRPHTVHLCIEPSKDCCKAMKKGLKGQSHFHQTV